MRKHFLHFQHKHFIQGPGHILYPLQDVNLPIITMQNSKYLPNINNIFRNIPVLSNNFQNIQISSAFSRIAPDLLWPCFLSICNHQELIRSEVAECASTVCTKNSPEGFSYIDDQDHIFEFSFVLLF